jgi:ATP-binding cassette subfamily B protein
MTEGAQAGPDARPARAGRDAARGDTPDAALRRPADRLLVRMARHGAPWAALLGVTSTAAATAETLFPAAAGHTIDVIIRAAAGPASATVRSGPGLSPAGRWLAACAALILVMVAGEALSQLSTGMSTAAATSWLRRRLTGHILDGGLQLAGRFPVGDLVGRMMGGAADAAAAPASGVTAVAAVIPPAGSLTALALIDPWLAVTFAAGLPVFAVVLHGFVRDASDVAAGYQRAQGAITARLLDALAGARTIAAAGTCEQEVARVLAPLAQVRRHGRASWRIQARIAAQGSLVVPLLQVAVVAVAGIELAGHRISPGELLAASQYAVLGAGIGGAVGPLSQVARARAGARRAAGPLVQPRPARGTATLPPGPGDLRLRGVTVRDGDKAVLADVDLAVPGGTVVAVAGRSGAGKSVLAALAGRLRDPDEGEVTLDGVPVTQLEPGVLRRAVVYAFDRPALFGDTPREAIAFGLPAAAGAARVVSAARDAAAYGFLRRLPAGLDAPLREAPMSGGEIQRIGLARAFARVEPARLLILDDATSSLDTVTELQVGRALSSRIGDRTALIITHRAATAARCDLVAWLDDSRLRALAPHRELWPDPDYRSIYSADAAPATAPGPPPQGAAAVAAGRA